MGISDDDDVHQCGRCKQVFRSIDDYFAHKKSVVCQKTSDPPHLTSTEDTRDDDDPPASTGPPEASPPAPAPPRRRRGRPRKAPKAAVSSEMTSAASGAAGCDVTQQPSGTPMQEDDLPIGRRIHSKRRRSTPKKLWKEDNEGEPDHGKTDEASGRADPDDDEEEGEATPPQKRQRRGRRKRPGRVRKTGSGGATSRDYACPKCDFTERDKDQFDRHLRREHNLTMYVCAGCTAPFRDKYKLKRHTDQCAAAKAKSPDDQVTFGTYSAKDPDETAGDYKEKPEENTTESAQTSVAFRCNECSYKAQTYEEIKEHLSRHPGKHPGICRFCGKWFASRYKLWRHMTSSVHDKVSEAAMQRAKAELRSRKISWPVSANRKRGSAGGATCDACAAAFRTKVLLERHVRDAHAPERTRRFRCGMCRSRFTKRRFLNDHLRGVHDMKGLDLVSHFRCPVCSRVFSQKGHMYRHHETLHTPVQQKPYTPAAVGVHPSQRAGGTSVYQQGETEPETTGDQRMNDGTCFARKDGVIVALGEKWVTVEPTAWDEEGPVEGADDGVDGDVHACFVCCRHLETRASYLRHIEQHRVWVALPDGPRPTNLFDTTALVELKAADKSVPTRKQAGRADASAETSTAPEAAEIVTVNFTIQPEMLTTINRSALIDMMQERDDVSGLRSHAATPGGDATEQAEKEKTLEAAAAIVDLSERAARLGASAVVPTASTPDDDVSKGAARLSRTAPDPDRGTGERRDRDPGECDDEAPVQQCPYCGLTTPGLEAMHAHKVTEHRIEAVFRCVQTTCDRTFDDVAAYREHSRVHSQLAFICTVCNAHFDDFCEILAHKSAVHRHAADGQRRQRCSLCNGSFFGGGTRAPATDRHDYCVECSKIVAGAAHEPAAAAAAAAAKTLLCDQCGVTCESRESLKRHMRAHQASRVHRCAQCAASFNKGEHLRRHVITKHSDERPFACKFPGCAKSFKRRDKLQEHHMAHSEVRPYVCRICARAYRYREGLRYHEKTHSRESKYRCDACGRTFLRPGLLQEHAKAFHDDTRTAIHVYACDVCNAKFPRPERMKRHMEREHKAVVAWKVYCAQCNMGFPGAHSLRSHVERQHPVEATADGAGEAWVKDGGGKSDAVLPGELFERQRPLVSPTRVETTPDTTQGKHTQNLSAIGDPLQCDPISGGHVDQSARVHVIEPLPSGDVTASYGTATSAPATASLPSLTTLQPVLMMPTAGNVGHGPPEVESAMRNDLDRPAAVGQQLMTGAGQLMHVMGDAMTLPVLVQGLPNEVPSGILLQQLPLVGMATTDSAHLHGGALPVAWQLGHVKSETMQRAETQTGTWSVSGQSDVDRQLALASSQPPSNQAGVAPPNEPMPAQQIIAVLNQPQQNLATVFNKSLPNQTVFAVNQNLPSQTHQALIAALNQPPQNHVATPPLQPPSLVEHNPGGFEAVDTLQSTPLNKPPTVPYQPNTALHPPVQTQAVSAAVSQMLQSQHAVPGLVQPAQSRSMSAAFSQVLQSPPRMSAMLQPSYTYGTVIPSSQPSQFGYISLNPLVLGPLDQSSLNQSQLPGHAAVSVLNHSVYNQPLSQVAMSALQSGAQTLGQVGMSASQNGPKILQILNHVGMSASQNGPQILSQVGMQGSQTGLQTWGQVAMSASQSGLQTLGQVAMSAPQSGLQTLGQVAMSASQSGLQTLGQVAMSASQSGLQTLGQVAMSAPQSGLQTLGQVAMSASQSGLQTLGQVAMSASHSGLQTVGQVAMSASQSGPQILQILNHVGTSAPQTLSQVGMSALQSGPQIPKTGPLTLTQVGIPVQTLGQTGMSASQTGPQTLSRVGLSALQCGQQTLSQVRNSPSQSAPDVLSQIGMSASQPCSQTLDRVGMSAQAQSLVGMSAPQNASQTFGQVGMSASQSPQVLTQVGMSASKSEPQTLCQVDMPASKGGVQLLHQMGMSASHGGSQTLSQVGLSSSQIGPQTLLQLEKPALPSSLQMLTQVRMSASQSGPQAPNQVIMSASQSGPQTLSQVRMPASQSGLQMLSQVSIPSSQSVQQTPSQLGMSALQRGPQTLTQVGLSALQTSSQTGMSALQSGTQTLSQVGMSALNVPQINRLSVAVVNPHTAALQSTVPRPVPQPCVAPVCSPRCLPSAPRVIHYPAPAAHSSMPAALSFTSHPSPKTPVSSSGKPPLAENALQEVGGTVLSIPVTRSQQSTTAQYYRSGAHSSSGHTVGATTLAYAASASGAPVTQYSSVATLPHAVHDRASHGDNSRCPSAVPTPQPTGATQPWWPPFNVPQTMPQTTVTKGDRNVPNTPMLAVQPQQAQTEMEDHMTRLSQVLSILTETSGVQQTLAGHTAPTVVSPSSRHRIHSDQATGNDLVTPAVRGQICSTHHENSTSMVDANTPRRGLVIPTRVVAATGCPQSPLDRVISTPCYGAGSTSVTTATVEPVSTTASGTSSAGLLSSTSTIASTQTAQDASGHVVLPALLPNELPFQNIPGYEAYSNF